MAPIGYGPSAAGNSPPPCDPLGTPKTAGGTHPLKNVTRARIMNPSRPNGVLLPMTSTKCPHCESKRASCNTLSVALDCKHADGRYRITGLERDHLVEFQRYIDCGAVRDNSDGTFT